MYLRTCAWKPPVVALVAMICLIGCTPPDNEPGNPTPAPPANTEQTTSSPSASPSATPPSATQRAEQEVVALTLKYYQVDEAIATDTDVPLKRYYEVASGKYVQTLLKAAQTQRSKGYKVTGEIKRTAPKIKDLQVRVSSDRLPSATTEVCLDVRQVKVVDKNGKSVVQPDRANAYLDSLKLEKKDYGWRVVDGENRKAQRCDG